MKPTLHLSIQIVQLDFLAISTFESHNWSTQTHHPIDLETGLVGYIDAPAAATVASAVTDVLAAATAALGNRKDGYDLQILGCCPQWLCHGCLIFSSLFSLPSFVEGSIFAHD